MNSLTNLLLFIAIFLLCTTSVRADRDFLWKKIDGVCVHEYKTNDSYKPCSLVDLDEKYAIYKVDNDKYQYLLLPTDKVSGIEDAKLQQDGEPNYLYNA